MPGDAAGAAGGAPEAPATAAPPNVDLALLGYDEGDVMGAPIRIIEFSDFGCVFCARFHNEDFEILYDEFVAGGEVAWKYIPVTLAGFPNADLAAVTAECMVEQGTFREIRSRIYEERESWMNASEAEAAELFASYVRAVGSDAETYRTCLASGEAARRLAASNEAARALGVSGTPTFIVEGFPVQGAPALSDFQEALRQMAAEIRAARGEADPGDEGTEP